MNRIPVFLLSVWVRRVLGTLLVVAVLAASSSASAYASDERPVNQASSDTALAPRTGKWIDIDLSEQRLRAYQGSKVVYTVRISSGTAKYPTVQGTFRVYAKNKSQRMRGGTGADRYDLPNVPNVMFFHKAYAIHGAYWHNNFGRPMSHGCINMPLGAAAWLYNWAGMGTTVVVHR
jgi:lipoprotein-anchoring transpeptidase ErfK/SrfK